ncbi:MAG: hypothetical protein U0892_08325 [Pirellulales bacterium]
MFRVLKGKDRYYVPVEEEMKGQLLEKGLVAVGWKPDQESASKETRCELSAVRWPVWKKLWWLSNAAVAGSRPSPFFFFFVAWKRIRLVCRFSG